MTKHTDQLPPGSLAPPEAELSPLDQIRQSEAEITRQIATARQQAVHSLDAARKEATQLITQARAEGQQEGKRRCQEIIKAAESEARELIVQAQVQVKEQNQIGAQRMELAVQQIVDLVIGKLESTGINGRGGEK